MPAASRRHTPLGIVHMPPLASPLKDVPDGSSPAPMGHELLQVLTFLTSLCTKLSSLA
jgi:hypothetical protein